LEKAIGKGYWKRPLEKAIGNSLFQWPFPMGSVSNGLFTTWSFGGCSFYQMALLAMTFIQMTL
jgi:hypothetical protein